MSVDFSRFFWKWSAPAAAAVGDMLKRELMRHAKRLTGLFESFEEAFRTGTRGEFCLQWKAVTVTPSEI